MKKKKMSVKKSSKKPLKYKDGEKENNPSMKNQKKFNHLKD
jgi:hypothetical protein